MSEPVASAEHMKAKLAEIKEESTRMCDTAVKREDVKNILLLALTAKDVENLHVLVAANPRAKNYAVLVRRLVAREAKAVRKDGTPIDPELGPAEQENS